MSANTLTQSKLNTIGDIAPATVANLLVHDQQWHQWRCQGIGGSDAARIMSGDWLSLWQEKTQRTPPQYLLDVLPVVMGSWSEPLNRYWFQNQTGMRVDLSNVSQCVHHAHPFLRANLDGRVGLGILECKHINAFAKLEEVRDRYYAQCQHNMKVVQSPICYLSVFIGTLKWDFFELEEDPGYQAELLARELEFWSHVEDDTPPPIDIEPQAPPPPIDDMRTVNMSDNQDWAAAATDWVTSHKAAKTFDVAAKKLKGLVEPDVRRAVGCGLTITRSKSGALRITQGEK